MVEFINLNDDAYENIDRSEFEDKIYNLVLSEETTINTKVLYELIMLDTSYNSKSHGIVEQEKHRASNAEYDIEWIVN